MPDRLVRDVQARASRRAWMVVACLSTLATLTTAGCNLPEKKPRPTLLTLADLEGLAHAGQTTILPDNGIPGGLPLADYVTDQADGYHLTLRDTWTEAYRSGYVTTEIWTGFDEVWAQPVYVPITGFVGGVPTKLTDASGVSHPIFSVGPKSAFYSPFWEVLYFQVPEGTDPKAYTSARQVIESGLALQEGRGRAMALVPGDVVLPKMSDVAPTEAGGDRAIGGPKASRGFLDGQEIPFLDFGAETFRWNYELVVEEIPLFVLLYRRPDGTLERLNVPTVAGTGPLYANRPVDAPNDHPRYGAFWRLYTVEIPSTARIFAPTPLFDPFRAQVPAALLDAPYGTDLLALAGTDKLFLDDWLGRVALNAAAIAPATTGCFEKYEYLDTNVDKPPGEHCQWLDSQSAIERAVVPEAINETDIVVTCPFVTYHDHAVTP
jgi:hypothetical protein